MKVDVNILGNNMTVETGDEPAEKAQKAAAFLDGRMKNVAKRGHLADTMKVALLTMLDITSEYLDLREKTIAGDTEAGAEIKLLNRKLEEAIKE